MIPNKFKRAEIFVTFFYLGKIKYCPGTFGSIAAFPLYYIVTYFTKLKYKIFAFSNFSHPEQQLFYTFGICLAVCILLFIVGSYYCATYLLQTNQSDPQEIVIDEVVGQLLVITLCLFSTEFIGHSNIINYISKPFISFTFLVFLPFVLFRFFDIVKPWPISWLDQNIPGSLGVMVDDIGAAIFAAVLHYTICFSIIDYLK